MARKAKITLVTILSAVVALTLVAYWWDGTRKDTIAEGVTIGGIAVGGLDSEAARRQLRTTLIKPLDKPVVVKFEGQRYKLSPNELDVHADLDGMVDEALDVSREGGIAGRTWRALSGGEVDRDVAPRIAYDEEEVDEFLAHVEEGIDRDPVDASVDPSSGRLEPVASRPGLRVAGKKLRRMVEKALQDPARRAVRPKVEKLKPEVTTSELAAKYPTYLVVDRSGFTLKLYKDLKLAKTYTVAIGAQGFDTPAGLYSIQNKQVDPVWSVPESDWAGKLAGETIPAGPENPLKARWMGIYDGAGIHGTNDTASLGSAASHGCVRMSVPDVEDLYDRVDVGTPIYIG